MFVVVETVVLFSLFCTSSISAHTRAPTLPRTGQKHNAPSFNPACDVSPGFCSCSGGMCVCVLCSAVFPYCQSFLPARFGTTLVGLLKQKHNFSDTVRLGLYGAAYTRDRMVYKLKLKKRDGCRTSNGGKRKAH